MSRPRLLPRIVPQSRKAPNTHPGLQITPETWLHSSIYMLLDHDDIQDGDPQKIVRLLQMSYGTRQFSLRIEGR